MSAPNILAEIKAHFPDARIEGVTMFPSRACANCLRETVHGLTYRGQPVCATCAPYSGALLMMTTDAEDEALEAGGAAGGAYLDSIGKTDLGELSPDQWRTFLAKTLEGYSARMREIAKNTAPF